MRVSDQIFQALNSYVNGNYSHLFISNFFLWGYECDGMLLTKSGLVTEYEIKISRQDFLQDFQKNNHWKKEGQSKHDMLKNGTIGRNYFYFVTLKGIVGIEDIPTHCGWIEYDPDLTYVPLTIKKVAPKLSKEKFFNRPHELWSLLQTLVVRNNAYKLKINRQKKKK